MSAARWPRAGPRVPVAHRSLERLSGPLPSTVRQGRLPLPDPDPRAAPGVRVQGEAQTPLRPCLDKNEHVREM